jgi:hypothetical protein
MWGQSLNKGCFSGSGHTQNYDASRLGSGSSGSSLILLKTSANLIYLRHLEQCFSTFWAPSPGRRQILNLLSRSLTSLGFCHRFFLQNIKNMQLWLEFLLLNVPFKYYFQFLLLFSIGILRILVDFKVSKLFQVPVPGRVPAVEKHWFRAQYLNFNDFSYSKLSDNEFFVTYKVITQTVNKINVFLPDVSEGKLAAQTEPLVGSFSTALAGTSRTSDSWDDFAILLD